MAYDPKTTQVPKIIIAMISQLPTRQKDIVTKRFGLKDGRRRTLEEIGDSYDITRERVRQIENDAKSRIRGSDHIGSLDPFFAHAISHFERHGGIRAEHQLLGRDIPVFFGKSTDEKIARAYLHFLFSLHDAFTKHSETDEFHALWALKNADPDGAKEALTKLTANMEEKKELIEKEKLLAQLQELTGNVKRDILESYLAVSKTIDANVYGEYGLKHWAEVHTRGVRDKAYLVLKKNAQPMHFREIVEHINKTFDLKRSAHPQTVHNELIKNSKFVLVGRGTYALSDWGYQPGRVADVLMRVLKEADKPLSREEIIEAVLKERNVKHNTIMLNLQNRQYFEKMEDGRFAYKR
ncbi:hypothetical protein A3C91_00440 [Candidatus Azambacteria bacterium RIFCSPHIGHO2_02_FULL_52_12]|uniref:HTH HARE-type domain-containing protein n=1 Tax=Candidatus Azambacteria bacterium RIFCSPLOWO2_01_FULL_46_25 TaxID=1797298 RepID=A0A1F5BTS3_9BACT|nr:MAG: hypothetical protein A3C91_00440 [Candidatus Azambacteria bacterium RIFCSPHIGHO2_02_FULL_52_12]OGD33974.1 MAG: hypothetical protein A2988_00610 [Candidatus Azambacteria bacterium RIFCSPLOWO2_01_FULL_46_25]OGD37660.1 MAG: hypothetical protein A2850_04685 [Candidatus Azambacteria bacterium RIFCSPHIGHO2_01_FULL_51_74]